MLFAEENDTEFSFVVIKPDSRESYEGARRKEYNGLMSRGTCKVVPESSVPKGVRIFGLCWVDPVKTTDGKSIKKSRLVARNYRGKGPGEISTRSPKISRIGIRIALNVAAMFPEYESYIRDMSQA